MKGFEYKKKFGQNFLTDSVLLENIVEASGTTASDVVVEIGAGKGALTEVLSKYAKKVISFEIDNELKEFLTQKFEGSNVQMVFDDAMKYSEADIKKLAGEKFKLVANLPYYVTSPILTKFLQMKSLISATVMVQEEVADRIIAQPKTKDYGVLTIMCQTFGEAKKVLRVDRSKFTPQPNVDSAVVKIERRFDDGKDHTAFFNFVKKAFAMRRKKLSVNLETLGLKKSDVESHLQTMGHSPFARAEELSIFELKSIFDYYMGKN